MHYLVLLRADPALFHTYPHEMRLGAFRATQVWLTAQLASGAITAGYLLPAEMGAVAVVDAESPSHLSAFVRRCPLAPYSRVEQIPLARAEEIVPTLLYSDSATRFFDRLQMQAFDRVRSASGELALAAAPPGDDRIALSVVMPFFHRLADFTRVLPLNAGFFASNPCEVILALDEPSEAESVVTLARSYPAIRWRVVVNRTPHGWRPPCRAINVGIRGAVGSYVLVCSPESAFAGDAPARALAMVSRDRRTAVVGHVTFATFAELAEHDGSVDRACTAIGPKRRPVSYGSMCAARGVLHAIHGYDESLDRWGGDDDNLRVRLIMAGVNVTIDPALSLLHLSDKPRDGVKNPDHSPDEFPEAYGRRIFEPETAVANPAGWGEEFDEVVFDWRKA
jgi:hypothetical protein